MNPSMQEPLSELFNRSKLMILDFSQIPADAKPEENIQTFFRSCAPSGKNPRLPENRQQFNNRMLQATNMRYLVSRYGEDRSDMLTGSKIAAQGRTLHMGVDIFAENLETVYAPCSGRIVRTGREPGDHGYGNYLILQPDHLPGIYFFFGHLSKNLPREGAAQAGDPIATLGDYPSHENGGWSRHLHLQVTTVLPAAGRTPDGYSTKKDFAKNGQTYPDPMHHFADWRVG